MIRGRERRSRSAQTRFERKWHRLTNAGPIIEVMDSDLETAPTLIERDEGSSNGSHEIAFRKLFNRVRDLECSEP